jgi:hypothetical protein
MNSDRSGRSLLSAIAITFIALLVVSILGIAQKRSSERDRITDRRNDLKHLRKRRLVGWAGSARRGQ